MDLIQILLSIYFAALGTYVAIVGTIEVWRFEKLWKEIEERKKGDKQKNLQDE